MSQQDEQEFKYLWTTERDNWVLVHIPNDSNDKGAQAVWQLHRRRMAEIGRGDEEPLVYSIANRTSRTMLIIKDDDLSFRVKRRMLDAGVRVMDIKDYEKEIKSINREAKEQSQG